MISFKKVGGLYHFRIGRFGGSFYIAKRKPVTNTIVLSPTMKQAISWEEYQANWNAYCNSMTSNDW